MAEANSTESPLEAAAEAAGPHAVEAFELLGNETRLAILLALWEAYDIDAKDNAVPFSELRDRVGIRQGAQFNYHLDKLVGRFVKKTDDGYEVRMAGFKMVKAILAGSGFREPALPPTEIDRSCHLCGAPVELTYDNQLLFQVCTECEGRTNPNIPDRLDRPGTLNRVDFDPAGLTHRTPTEVFVAGTVDRFRKLGVISRGLCPACSGPIEDSLHSCDDHEAPPGEVCPTCRTRHEVRVRYVCPVCKWYGFVPVEAAVYDHPAVIGFCHDHGIPTTYDVDPESCGRLWEHFRACEHAQVSTDPVRVRVSVPGDGEVLSLTFSEDLAVVDVSKSDRNVN